MKLKLNLTLRHHLVATSMLLSLTAAHAQVTVKNAWVRATVPQQKATGAFMQLTAARDTQLVAVSSPLTPETEIHEMVMKGDVMQMRQVPAVPLPAGKTVDFQQGGYHVMLMNLKQAVQEGSTVPMTLWFQDKNGKRTSVEITAPVRALNNAGHGGHAH